MISCDCEVVVVCVLSEIVADSTHDKDLGPEDDKRNYWFGLNLNFERLEETLSTPTLLPKRQVRAGYSIRWTLMFDRLLRFESERKDGIQVVQCRDLQ